MIFRLPSPPALMTAGIATETASTFPLPILLVSCCMMVALSNENAHEIANPYITFFTLIIPVRIGNSSNTLVCVAS